MEPEGCTYLSLVLEDSMENILCHYMTSDIVFYLEILASGYIEYRQDTVSFLHYSNSFEGMDEFPHLPIHIFCFNVQCMQHQFV